MAPLFTANWFNFGRTAADSSKPNISATGGTTSTPGDGYKYHEWTSSGSFVINSNPDNYTFQAIMFGGGGGGGNGGDMWGGGGGAAGGIYIGNPGNMTLNPGTHPVTIGAGGSQQSEGADTQINWTSGGSPITLTCQGGGYGGSRNRFNPPGVNECNPGGSGGGQGASSGNCNATQPNQSNPGPPGFGVTQIGSNAPTNGPGGTSNPTNDADINWDLDIISSGPLGPGKVGRGGPGGAPGQPGYNPGSQPAATWTGTPICYGSGGNGSRGGGGTGGGGVVVCRYEWYDN